MKRGPKTAVGNADDDALQQEEAIHLPVQPDWLTPEGREVWAADIERIELGRLATARDSTSFANYCNLQGQIVRAWRLGETPPAAYLSESRKLQEIFGICGAQSRAQRRPPAGGTTKVFGRGRRAG
ncbi:hypothetical protein [Azospirillum argentinense]|uniref:Phage terminase small subunit P27 family n=1 Tax=Azospirillum brasilense TaxID=192 RepID=A0A4D8QFC9_AZOBR|nr:hypothetical protein [Azospirillum argentinense]QCO07523.1 hypothetical protein D3867_37195 [Azospirillum argentinense]